MYERDLLVGLIAFGLGFLMISSAVMNYERAFEMPTPQFLINRIGRRATRYVIGFIGLLVVAMGIYILLNPFWSDKDESPTHAQLQLVPESLSGRLVEGK